MSCYEEREQKYDDPGDTGKIYEVGTGNNSQTVGSRTKS